MAHGFDTTKTKLLSSTAATIYGRFKAQIDFAALSSYAWGSWSNADFESNVDYVVLELYSDSNRTQREAILVWQSSDFTSGQWYSTKTFSTAYFANTISSAELPAAVSRGKLPISVHHFVSGAPGHDSNIGHDFFLTWKIINTPLLGNASVPTFTASGKTSITPDYDAFTQMVPATPVLVLEHNLVSSSSPNYYATGIRVTDNTLQPKIEIKFDIDGGKSKNKTGDNWNDNSPSWSTRFAAVTGVDANINNTNTNNNRFRYRVRTYTAQQTGDLAGFAQGLAAFDINNYSDGLLIKPGTDYFTNTRTTDEDGNTLSFTRPSSNVVTYMPFIIEAVIVDVEEEVYAYDNGVPGEIVFGQYWSIAPNFDLGESNSAHVAWIPPAYRFDEANGVALNNTQKAYTAAVSGNASAQQDSYIVTVKGDVQGETIPEYATTSDDLRKYVASKIILTIKDNGTQIGSITDLVIGDIIDDQNLNFTFDYGTHLDTMWDSQTFQHIFTAYDSDNNILSSWSKNVVINNEHFNFPLANVTAGDEITEILQDPGQTGFPVTLDKVRLATTETTSARRKLNKVVFDVRKNGSVVHTSTYSRYNNSGSLYSNNLSATYDVVNHLIEEDVSIYTASASLANLAAHSLRVRVYGFNGDGSDLELDDKYYGIYTTTRRAWTFASSSAIRLSDFSGPNVHQDGVSTWSIDRIDVYAGHFLAAAHDFRIRYSFDAAGGWGGDTYRTITGVTAANTLTYDGLSGQYYFSITGSDLPTEAELNNRFTSIYNNAGYRLYIKVTARDNTGATLADEDLYYNISTERGLEPAALDTTGNISIFTHNTGTTAVRKSIRALFRRDADAGGSNPAVYSGQAAYFRMDLYKNNSTASSDLLAKYYTTGTGGSTTHHGFNRTTFKQHNSLADYLADNTAHDTIYLGDIPNWNTTYGATTFKAILRALDDDGNFLTDTQEAVTFTPYQFSIDQASSAGLLFVNDDGVTNTSYRVNAKFKPANVTNSAFDYAVLTITNVNDHTKQITQTLSPASGQIFSGLSEYTFPTVNIHSIINDRYEGTNIHWRIEVFAYGLQSPSNQATMIASLGPSNITQNYIVSPWRWSFHSSSVGVLSQDLESCDLTVQYQADDASTDLADRFKLEITNPAQEKETFFIAGVSFDGSNQTRTTDTNWNPLDIISLVNTTTNRHSATNSFSYELTAQVSDGSGNFSDVQANGYSNPVASGQFGLTVLDFIISNVMASLNTDVENSTILNVSVTKQNHTHVTNRLDIKVTEQSTLSGTVNTTGNSQTIAINSNHNFGKITTTGGQRTENFSIDITNLSNIDRFDVTQLKVTAQPVYNAPQGSVFAQSSGFDDSLGSVDGWKPYFKIDASTTTFTLNQQDMDSMSVNLNVRGSHSSALTENPSGFVLNFTDTLTGDVFNGTFVSLANANVDTAGSNGEVTVDIENLFTTFKDEDRNIECEIVPRFSNGSGGFINGTSITKTLKVDKEPKIVFDDSPRRGMLLDAGGGEYFATRFRPKIENTNLANFIPNNENFFIDVTVKESQNDSVIATRTYTMTGSQISNFHAITIPTGVDVYNDDLTDFKYYATFKGYYDLNRSGNHRINGALDTTSFRDDSGNTFQTIHHRFPKVLEDLDHSFDANGTGELSFSFEKVAGLDTGYSTGRSDEWEFVIDAEEEVLNALDPSNIGNTKTLNNIDAGDFDTNTLPWVSEIPLEANYLSKIKLTIQEKYKNKTAIGNVVLTNFGKAVNLEHPDSGGPAGGTVPDWNNSLDEISQTRLFEKTNITMNDLANFPNTTVVPTNIVVSDIQGEYAASGRRFTFDVPLDFSTYFTNAEPSFSFGLKIRYYDNNGAQRHTLSSYISSTGQLIKSSSISAEKLAEVQNSSVYAVRDFGQDGGDYYFDLEFEPDNFDYEVNPSITTARKIQYTLMVFISDELETYNSKITTAPIAFNDIENWQESVVGVEEDLYTKSIAADEWVPQFSNFSVQPKNTERTQFEYSLAYALSDEKKKAFQFTEVKARWVGQFKNNTNANIGSEFMPNIGRTFSSGAHGPTTHTIDLTSLDDVDFNPFEDTTVEFKPRMTLDTKAKNSYHFGLTKDVPITLSYTVNYKNLIVPSFSSLSVDDSLNEDTINNDRTEFTNKVVWFYDKTALNNVTEVFTVSQEWVVLRRKIRQGEQTFDGGHSQNIYLYGTDVVTSGHDVNTNKYTYTDSDVNLNSYTAQGLNADEAFIFEYEITPMFRYGISQETATDTEISEQKISTFLIPDEFPYANNGVTNLSTHSVHESKHSIHLKWDYQYTESLDTFKAMGAQIHFDLYWYADETNSQKQVKEKLKPKRKKLERIAEKQNINTNWNFIKTIDYIYPESPTLNELYKFSCLWKYDKLETDFNIRVAVITRIESEILGTLSQTVGTAGASNSFVLDVKTSDRARKEKLHNEEELKRTPNRHLKRESEFTTSLPQIPFTVTRKKAKPRGDSNTKPYTSTT